MKSIYSIILALAWCISLGFTTSSSAALSCGNTANCYINTADAPHSVQEGVFKASWSVTGNNTLNVSVEAETTGWVAIGFSKTASMDDTDYVMGGYNASTSSSYGADYFYNGAVTAPCIGCTAPLLDTTLATGSSPATDSKNNLLSLTSSEANGVTTLNFSRLLNTQDTTGDYDLSNGDYSLVWAYRKGSATGDDLSKFHSGGRGVLAANVNFVPLPSAFWLLGSGLIGLWSYGRKSK